MRKAIFTMVVLSFVVPALAGTVNLSVTDVGEGWAAIRYTADANVSGFGLKIYTTVDANAIITDIKDYNVGESKTGNKVFGIFPGTIDINETTGNVDGNGTPIAPNDAPGASGTGLNTDTIIVEMGALYEDGNQPGLSGTLILVHVDRDCNVCVEGEPVRGKVVLTDANEAILVPPVVCARINPDCLKVGEYAGGVLITPAMFNNWVLANKPPCWCYDCHWRGDTDGDCVIAPADVTEALAGWFDWVNHPCADVDNDGVVAPADITIMLTGWFQGCTDVSHPDYPNSGTCTPLP